MQTRLNYIFCKRYIYFPVHTLLQISNALPPKETPYHWKKHYWCGLIEFENITYYMHTYYTQRYFSNEKLCCTLTLEGGGGEKIWFTLPCQFLVMQARTVCEWPLVYFFSTKTLAAAIWLPQATSQWSSEK